MLKLWIDAARPRTLPVSVGPVVVAAAYAWYFDVFHPVIVSVCVVFALLAQIASSKDVESNNFYLVSGVCHR